MFHRWQILALTAVLLLPFVGSLVAGPGMGEPEVFLWLMSLLLIAAAPAVLQRLRGAP
jgi:hypothetical protein